MTKILAVASEVFPLVKTGGLADVVGALPSALKHHGIEMRVMLPVYPAVAASLKQAKPIHHYDDLFGGKGLELQLAASLLLDCTAPILERLQSDTRRP